MERATSVASRSLFPRGPSFTLDDFSSKDFVVRDFVDTLAETALPSNRRSGVAAQQAFDPKPLIRTFENALSQLGSLSEDLQERESEILSQVRRAEIQHDQTVDILGSKLDQSMEQFEALGLSLNATGSTNSEVPSSSFVAESGSGGDTGGGNIAVQIGEKLEEVDRQRRRALDATFLVQCWTELSETGQLTRLQDIQRQGGAENKVRCAVIARQLVRISQRLDPASWVDTRRSRRIDGVNGVNGTVGASTGNGGTAVNGITANTLNSDSGSGDGTSSSGTHNTREALEKFSETLEQDLLKQFNNSYRRQNFDDMMECARVLHDFNGGTSVIAAFVNQHQFFIDRDQLLTDEVTTDGELWNQLADPDADPPGVEPSLQSLLDEVKIVMQEESFIIKRAFPYYETVLIKFIQRVFQQSIQQRLEMVLEQASTVSTLAYLRSLHASRSYLGSLVEDLKAHGLTEHPEVCSGAIAQTLDQQVEELFVPYLVGSSYIDKERKSLEAMCSSLLFKFTVYHSRRPKAARGGFMTMIAQQGTHLLASAKDAYTERLESSDLTATQKAMMLRVAGIQEGDTNNNKNDIEVAEADGALQTVNAKRMLRWMAESVRRALELGSAADTPKDVNVLLGMLMTTLGRVYVETALDAALDAATAQENAKTEPDLGYLAPAVRPAVTIASLLARFVHTVLIRLAEGNSTMRRSMEAQTRTGLDVLENKTNAVLKTTVDVVVNWVSKTLATQKRTDFRPRDNDLETLVDALQTPTCQAVCTFLERAVGPAVAAAVDGRNRDVLSSDLALALFRLLFDHFKKFAVNATGGLMVTKDLAKYVTTLKAWPLSKDAAVTVDVLTEVGYLFIIGPEALRERSRNLVGARPATGVSSVGRARQSGRRGGSAGTVNGTAAGGNDDEPGKRLLKVDFKAFVQRREDASSTGILSVLASL